MNETNYTEQFQADQQQIEKGLRLYVEELQSYGDLPQAMEYSLLSGGKRIRPVLVLEACRFCGGESRVALPLACAIEMVHTYSLIHDDLPCMDDDALRRGRPTNHKVYGEATALLAGDALLTDAFRVIAEAPDLSPYQVTRAVFCLAQAAGSAGMVAGQILDMAGEGHALTLDDVREIESLKTGHLILAAVQLGCIAAGVSGEKKEVLEGYAQRIGLAFQIQDDILDVQGEESRIGKPVGSDTAKEKSTFVTLKGIAGCRAMVEQLTKEAVELLEDDEAGAFLCWLAQKLSDRDK